MKYILKVLLYIWQFPQNIVGLVFLLFLSPSTLVHDYGHTVVRQSRRMRGGISLGNNIFVQEHVSKATIWHEVGHARQSLLLDPLYLVVIGLPSLLWAGLHSHIAPPTGSIRSGGRTGSAGSQGNSTQVVFLIFGFLFSCYV